MINKTPHWYDQWGVVVCCRLIEFYAVVLLTVPVTLSEDESVEELSSVAGPPAIGGVSGLVGSS